MAERRGMSVAYIAVLAAVCTIAGVFILQRYPNVNVMSLLGGGSSHVVVVGGGLAGLSATLEALQHGATVTIIEKEERIGGNSAKATSGINGVESRTQEAHEIHDTVEDFIKDIIASGGGLSDPEKVRVLAERSASAIDFLFNLGLNLTEIVQLGGHSAARTHRFAPTAEGKPVPVGFTMVSALRKRVEESGYVTVKTKCDFQGLHKNEDGRVIGVKYSDGGDEVKVVEGVVVLTAGGYANDHTESSLLKQYTPDLYSYPTTNGPWATGDIIKAMENNHVSLIHMDKVQVHPTGFVDPKDPTFHTKFLAPEALRGCGAILLNKAGKRFANELGRRDYVTDQILKHGWRFDNKEGNPIAAAMLLTSDVIDKFGAPSVGFYKFKGLIVDVGTLAGAAEKLGVGEDVLKDTVKKYAQAADESEDEFGKVVFPTEFSENHHYFLAYITPTLHYCMGGLEINTNAQVLQNLNAGKSDADPVLKPIPGVFAAGEVTGGVHGKNRLGGNSLLECVVYGRIAGQHAAHYKNEEL